MLHWSESERLLTSALGNLTDAFIWVTDADVQRMRWISTSAGSVLGQHDDLWRDGELHLELHVEEDRHLVESAVASLRSGVLPPTYRARVRTTDGAIRWIEYSFTDLREHPEVRGFVGLARDVTDVVAEESSRSLEGLLPLATARGEVLVLIDTDGAVGAVTSNVRAVLGFDAGELQGRLIDFIAPTDRAVLLDAFRQVRQGSATTIGPGRVRAQRLDGSWLTLEFVVAPAPGGVLMSFRDVTREAHAEEALADRLQPERLAPPAGVPQPPGPARHRHELVWIGWTVQDAWRAHAAEVQRQVEARLARLSPVLPCAGHPDDQAVVAVMPGSGSLMARPLLGLLDEPFVVEGTTVDVAAVAAVAAADVRDVAVARAETAGRNALADHARRGGVSGRARLVVVDEQLAADLDRRRRLEDDALAGLVAGELRLRYRPEVDLRTGMPVALEALLAGETGVPDPEALAAQARRVGLAEALHRHLVDLLVADATGGGWPGAPRVVLPRVALHVGRSDCPAAVGGLAVLRASGVDTASVEVAIRAADAADAPFIARHCRDAGARVVLEGVGGAVSLEIAADVRPDVVRLDRSVTRRVGREAAADVIAECVMLFASRLGMVAAADGIEDERQRDRLRSLGYRSGSGRLYGDAAPLASFRHRA